MIKVNSFSLLKSVLVLVAVVIIATNLFLLLASRPSITPLEKQLESKAKALQKEADSIELSARRKEMRWAATKDSLTNIVNQKPPIKIVYEQVDTKVITDTRSFSERELDSVLTNYRFVPISETRDR